MTFTKGHNRSGHFRTAFKRIIDRIQKDQPEFRRLSFGKLRKSGSSLMRRFKGRAVAYGVFFRTLRKFGIRMPYGAQFSNPASVFGARSASKISSGDSSALKGGEVFLSPDP